MAYAINFYTGDGSTTTYSLTFPYISQSDVQVKVNNVIKTLGVDYTFPTSSTITFTTAPANGLIIKFTRTSNRSARLVDYQDGSTITEAILDQDSNQMFYMAQEAIDITENTIALADDDKFDANNKVIKNVANPVNDTDAVNKQFISTNLPNITTVAGISADVTTVAGISGNVTTVAGNNANVSTVATNIASVNTVATNIADVITVANDLNEAISEIETTANDLNEAVSEIDTVGTNIASVQAVGTNIANVNTVAGSIANVNSVAGNSTNINAVAGNATNINAVNANSSNINAVNANSANINTVAGNNANVSTVAGISGNVTTVAGISADVTAVAGDATDIGTVATDIANVNTVAGSIANVNSVATNIANVNSVAGNSANINAVAGNATNINAVNANSANINTVAGANANVTTVAGSIANVNTVATNINSVNNFGERYRVQAGEPSTNNDEGDLVYDTTANAVKVYNGTSFDTIQQGITDVAPTRHSIRPSLNLDFANSKVLDPRITFTRASNATYYDGYTSVKAEENLFKYSQEFDNSYWGDTRINITANDTTAPDGTTTAEKISESTITTNVFVLYQEVGNYLTPIVNNSYTTSIYAKADTLNFFAIRIYQSSTKHSTKVFDLSGGTITASDQSGTDVVINSASITNVGSGWYRCSVTFTTTTTTLVQNGFCLSDSGTPAYGSNGEPSYTSTGTGSVFIWGAQLEQRDSLTAYTPTTSSPITKYQPALQTAGNNVARFDHNPTTGESLGLLIEESRTNLDSASEDFSTWSEETTSASATLRYRQDNVIIAPDGTLTGTKISTSTSLDVQRIYKAFIGLSTNTIHTFSVYVKSDDYNIIIQDGQTAQSQLIRYNLDNVTSTDLYGNAENHGIENVGNGWRRIFYSAESSASGFSTPQVKLEIKTGTITTEYVGDGYSGIYLWGSQLEQGSFPTSYIKTTGSQVTRSAEYGIMTPSNTADFFNFNEGTVFADVDVTSENYSGLFSSWYNSDNRLFSIDTHPDNYVLLATRANGNYIIGNLSINNTNNAKYAIGFKRGDYFATGNGGSLTYSSNSLEYPLIASEGVYFGIGTRAETVSGGAIANTSQLKAHIKKLSYYPIKLTNNEIIDLTEE